MKKLLAFDLDDTLAVTKSPISDQMVEVLGNILDHFDVCIISGGKFEQFKNQVIDRLDISPMKLRRMHMMPTCGTRYYRYDETSKDWELQYAEDLTEEQKEKIVEALESSAKELGYWEENPAGDIIEDRNSQITYSALGQKAEAEAKYAWDPDGSKKQKLRSLAAEKLPDLEVRTGGSTSIDVTRLGIDKAYGMQKLIDALDISREEILFFGDKLQEGGNDYPVKAMGIDSLEVDKWQDTAARLETILKVLN
jgi:HAD superfamily hydrolase (TIGR01484 family)